MELIELQIGCELREIARVRRALREWLDRRGDVSQETIDAVALAAHEATSNAVRHARPCSAVTIRARLEAETVLVEVTDTGRERWSFSTENKHGLGYRLMTGLMREVETVSGPAGTTVRMSRRAT